MTHLLRVRVNPRSGRSEILEQVDAVWRIALKSPPEDGKANRELLKVLGKALKVAPTTLEIASGEKSRNKTVRVPGLSAEEIDARLSRV